MPRPKKNSKSEGSILDKDKILKNLKIVKGAKDVLVSDRPYWDALYNAFKDRCAVYRFNEIGFPVVEYSDMYVAAYGGSEIEKQLLPFPFVDKEKIVLQYDRSISAMRAYLQHGMDNLPQPAKLAYWGPTLEILEDSDGGKRLKQMNQVGFSMIGEEAAVTDAQLILMGYSILQDVGLDVTIHLNSLGCEDSMILYRQALNDYYKQYKNKFSAADSKLIKKDPLNLLLLEDESYAEIIEGAPQILDYLTEGDKSHFFALLEYLDDLEIPYNIDSQLIRLGDQYNRTIFSYKLTNARSSKNSLLGYGGRHDLLGQLLGAKDAISSTSVTMNTERIVAAMKNSESFTLPEKEIPDVFVAQIGEQARRRAIILFEDLRKKGFSVVENFATPSLKEQLDIARKFGVKYTLILGQKEVTEGTILLRDMEGGIQETTDLNKIPQTLKKLLKSK